MTATAASPSFLRLEHIAKQYTTVENMPPLKVLTDSTLQLESGDSAAIIGPSGSGKSTLLNIIGTLDRPTSGRVLFEGRDLAALSDWELGKLRNRSIGFVFQKHYLLPQLTVLENVLVPTLVSYKADGGAEGHDRNAQAERAALLLKRVKLDHRLTHRPGRLSGGECQRVALVRALINRPQLLLADEPTGSLDRKSSQTLMELLHELNESEGIAMIVVTHAREVSDQMHHVYELREGALHSTGRGNA